MNRTGIGLRVLSIFAVFLSGCPGPGGPSPGGGPTPTPVPSVLSLPTDANATCPVSAATFNGWFKSGSVSLDGEVKPADSTMFSPMSNCTFFEWSEQMFLWLTSPAPPTYGGGGGRIFNSPVFFGVSPLDTGSNTRTFIKHPVGIAISAVLRSAQVGPQGFPVILDKQRKLFEVVRPPLGPNAKPMVLDSRGRKVEVGRVTIGAEGQASFFDRDGRPIERARLIGPRGEAGAFAERFMVDHVPVFIDKLGKVIDVEQGQSESEVLESQTNSLIYYIPAVNDVFAYFLTGVKTGGIKDAMGNAPKNFPTTQTELDAIKTFASSHGKNFPDPEALAVELKSSWVEASTLPNPDSYIRVSATIPTYDTSNADLWTLKSSKTVELAMVGMHVVGSTSGHPEMIWATFEHVGNTPNATYTYDSPGGMKSVTQDTSGSWLFSTPPDPPAFNKPHMRMKSGTSDIEAISPFHVSPSDTLRTNPWGSDPTFSGSNTEVISINNSVRGMLAGGDVRANYVMIGATWTPGGDEPDGSNGVGTNQLSNTTMETYQQGSNCFSCHSGGMLSGLSHIYGPLEPLTFP